MSVASMHAAEFFAKVAREGRVFTFLSEQSFLVFSVHGSEVVPFWSSRSRLARVQALHPKYRAWEMEEQSLDQFLHVTLPALASGGIRVGVNWAGQALLGYDQEASVVASNLTSWKAKLSA